MFDCMKPWVLDLSDLYLTRKEHARTVRNLRGAMHCLTIGIFLMCMIGIEQDARIQRLEQKLEKKETAG